MPGRLDHVTVTSRKGWRHHAKLRLDAPLEPVFTEMEDTVVDQLCKASAQGNLAAVKRLLQNGVDVNGLNTFNRTALQVSVREAFMFYLAIFSMALLPCFCSDLNTPSTIALVIIS